jgi:hypothetical protein
MLRRERAASDLTRRADYRVTQDAGSSGDCSCTFCPERQAHPPTTALANGCKKIQLARAQALLSPSAQARE